MNKILLILLCLPLLFSCGDENKIKKLEDRITELETKKENKDEGNISKELTIQMLKNRYTGQGTSTCASGDKYIGEYKDNFFNGQGTKTFGKGKWEGDKYVGKFKNNLRHGQGTYTWADGTFFSGLWKNDKFLGE